MFPFYTVNVLKHILQVCMKTKYDVKIKYLNIF